jgi:hypothetical protein
LQEEKQPDLNTPEASKAGQIVQMYTAITVKLLMIIYIEFVSYEISEGE